MENEDTFARSSESNTEVVNSLPDDFLLEVDRELENLQLLPDAETLPNELALPALDGLSEDPGMRQMQLTFLDLTRNSLSPISRYMKAISQGESYRDLLEISEMIVTPLVSKTEEVGLSKHADDLLFFRSLLFLALGERDQEAIVAMREVVMEGYFKLSERFGLSFRGYRLAARNLVQFYRRLRTTEGVGELNLRRFFAIGVPSLTWVRRTRVAELTGLSGIPLEAMAKIRKVAAMYRGEKPVASAMLARDQLFPPREEEPFPGEEILGDDLIDLNVANFEVRTPRGQA